MKVFQMNDCDWMVGPSIEACIDAYKRDYSDDPACTADARELDEDSMDKLTFIDTDENERPTGEKRTFREQLDIEISNGGPFPRLFASTEW